MCHGNKPCDPETYCVSAVAFAGSAYVGSAEVAGLDADRENTPLASASVCKLIERLAVGETSAFDLVTDRPITASPAHFDVLLTTMLNTAVPVPPIEDIYGTFFIDVP
jgi:hypothetical protein